jgi:hypothetical protein
VRHVHGGEQHEGHCKAQRRARSRLEQAGETASQASCDRRVLPVGELVALELRHADAIETDSHEGNAAHRYDRDEVGKE